MRDWFFEHTFLASVCVLLSLANPEVLVIFMSGTSGSLAPGSLFRAPFSKKGRRNLHSAGLVGNFLEDIPQIVLQAVRFVEVLLRLHREREERRVISAARETAKVSIYGNKHELFKTR